MPRRDAATIVLAGVMPTALGLAINFATDRPYGLWPWLQITILGRSLARCSGRTSGEQVRRKRTQGGNAKRNPAKVPSQLHRDDGHRWRFSTVPAELQAWVAMALGGIVALGPGFLAPAPAPAQRRAAPCLSASASP